ETAGQASDKHPTSTRQAPDKYPTSIVRLIELIGEHTSSLKEMMGMMELKDRENILGNYLNPSMEAGLVEP
ncbi:ATP-dependent DNA helicase RecG, partial [Phocaeicola vulgatus]|uniref:Fic family protein n=1 Tax=Phocaeicola vulgatus TaxID=821 RepID=UPI0034E84B63|nr:ATP-dependent DNA helicase RecG [Phocaeicola vulgatus]